MRCDIAIYNIFIFCSPKSRNDIDYSARNVLLLDRESLLKDCFSKLEREIFITKISKHQHFFFKS